MLNVYRSSDGNSLELLSRISEMLTMEKPTLITGDFNICMLNHEKNRLSKGLSQNGFCQMVKDATHIRGGHIDHVYWKDEHSVWKDLNLLPMYISSSREWQYFKGMFCPLKITSFSYRA